MRKRLFGGLVMGVFFLFATSGFAAVINGVTIEYASSEYYAYGWDLRAEHVVDGSGLAGAGHNQIQYPGGNSWQTITQSGTGTIVFDLGTSYKLDKLHVWNLNFYAPYNGRGAYQVDIFTSADNSVWNLEENSYVFSQATGLDGDQGFDIMASQWQEGRYIKFDILNNFGTNDNAGHVGLSEVQFYSSSSVPIPAAVWLFGSGLLGLIGVRGRKISG